MQGKVTSQCPQLTIFEEKGEPKRGIEPESFRLTSRAPYHQAKPAHRAAVSPVLLGDMLLAASVVRSPDTATPCRLRAAVSPVLLGDVLLAGRAETSGHCYTLLSQDCRVSGRLLLGDMMCC